VRQQVGQKQVVEPGELDTLAARGVVLGFGAAAVAGAMGEQVLVAWVLEMLDKLTLFLIG
jgi:hypothetical protein